MGYQRHRWQLGEVCRGRRRAVGHHDSRHLCRAFPAPYSGAVHPSYDWPQDVRRILHLSAAEDQYERRYPADLRVLHSGHSDPDRTVRQFQPVLGQVDQLQPGQHHFRVVHRTVRADDRVLLLLLHGNHLQPGRDRRQHEAVWRLHSGHPRRQRHQPLSELRDEQAQHRRRRVSAIRGAYSDRAHHGA